MSDPTKPEPPTGSPFPSGPPPQTGSPFPSGPPPQSPFPNGSTPFPSGPPQNSYQQNPYQQNSYQPVPNIREAQGWKWSPLIGITYNGFPVGLVFAVVVGLLVLASR